MKKNENEEILLGKVHLKGCNIYLEDKSYLKIHDPKKKIYTFKSAEKSEILNWTDLIQKAILISTFEEVEEDSNNKEIHDIQKISKMKRFSIYVKNNVFKTTMATETGNEIKNVNKKKSLLDVYFDEINEDKKEKKEIDGEIKLENFEDLQNLINIQDKNPNLQVSTLLPVDHEMEKVDLSIYDDESLLKKIKKKVNGNIFEINRKVIT